MTRSIYDHPEGREIALVVVAEQSDRSGKCWLWTGDTLAGYGSFKISGAQLYSHRSSYEAHVGPIPTGLVIRHSCDQPLCVNPEHLLPGTQLQNMQDRDERGRNANLSKTHCAKGHSYDETNTRKRKGGGRDCVTCQREASRKWAGKNGASAMPERYYEGLKTHCAKGHPFDEANTVVRKNGNRDCRTCKRAADRRYAQRNVSKKAGA